MPHLNLIGIQNNFAKASAVYGLFDENVDENVIESHISKLRKKLKHRLGFDPIDSKRFLGYCIDK